jgi:hypothetical protein
MGLSQCPISDIRFIHLPDEGDELVQHVEQVLHDLHDFRTADLDPIARIL